MPWTTETGLIDDYDLAVERAQFATDGRYQSGEVLLLQWFGKATDQDGSTFDHQVLIPCGAGWESRDGGKTAVHPQGKDRFNRSSILGRIIDRCVDEFGIGDTLGAKGDPSEASTWEGLSWHMKREKISFGGDIGAKEREMPVKFLGTGAHTSSDVKASGNGASAAASTNVLLAKIKAAAKTAGSHSEFVDKVMADYPEVADDAGLLEQVVDESALYAAAH